MLQNPSATSQSSTIPSISADADEPEGLARTLTHARGFYGVIALATKVGLGLNLLGINPITALVYTAIINGVVEIGRAHV